MYATSANQFYLSMFGNEDLGVLWRTGPWGPQFVTITTITIIIIIITIIIIIPLVKHRERESTNPHMSSANVSKSDQILFLSTIEL